MTMSPGGTITMSGTPIYLPNGQSEVVIGTSTEGLGAVIMSGFGSKATSTANENAPSGNATTSGLKTFQGTASTTMLSTLDWRLTVFTCMITALSLAG